jgi:hypothetical protein
MPLLKKFAAKAEKLFRKSHGSRDATATTLQSAAAGADASGTEGTRQQWVPATKNAVELVKKFDEVLLALGNGKQLISLKGSLIFLMSPY